jgi:hypothetical protein
MGRAGYWVSCGKVVERAGRLAQRRAHRVWRVDVEAQSRLSSVLTVIEHEAEALEDLHDDRLTDVLQRR